MKLFREKVEALLRTTTVKVIVSQAGNLNSALIIEELKKPWSKLRAENPRKFKRPKQKRVNC